MPTKLTVNLPDAAIEAIKQIAEQSGVTYTEAIRRAIENERFLRDEISKGHELIIKKEDGPYRVILR